MQIKHPAAFTLTLLCAGAGAFAAPQLIIVNANVFTADPARPRAQAVAIEDGRFSAVGDDAQIRAMAGPATRVIDAGGRLATPGLIEAHVHIGWGLPWAPLAMPGLPFPGPTAEHALAAVAAAARQPGDWISARQTRAVARLLGAHGNRQQRCAALCALGRHQHPPDEQRTFARSHGCNTCTGEHPAEVDDLLLGPWGGDEHRRRLGRDGRRTEEAARPRAHQWPEVDAGRHPHRTERAQA